MNYSTVRIILEKVISSPNVDIAELDEAIRGWKTELPFNASTGEQTRMRIARNSRPQQLKCACWVGFSLAAASLRPRNLPNVR
jgi:hypothetical protein